MKKYTPNFNDPRVQRKAHSALQWATCVLKEDEPSGWARTHLDKRIGFNHNSLGAWLRTNLLQNTNPYYHSGKGIAKGYTLNAQGAAKIASLLGIDYNPRKIRKSIALQTSIEQYSDVFRSGAFEYVEKNHRVYNEMQNIRTDIRRPLFRHYGYKFNYDIENAYPTLILQYAQQHTNIRKPLSTIEDYVQNTPQRRQELANNLGVDYKTAKKILIAKFNGASLSPQGSITQMLTRLQRHRLLHDVWFNQLCQEINRAWNNIARSESKKSMRSRERMMFYMRIEQRVMRLIYKQFELKQINIFQEHDGWRATDWIDPYHLELVIRKRLGYRVKIKCEVE